MKHRLLILGTLGEFVQLVKKSKERGYYTIVCDGYPDGPARQYADASYVIPVTDIDAVAELCQKEMVDGIITSFSDLLMECMVKIAEKAGLPCYLRPEQLCWYRDKSACRELLSKLGLPTPGFVKVPAAEQNEYKLAEITAGLKYPLISKPLDKYGSRGIFIIKDQEQLAGSVRKTAEFTDLDEILIEEYNDGFEFNMMTWVSDGAVRVISIADREKTQFAEGELPESTRNVYPSCLIDKVEEPAVSLLQSYARYLSKRCPASFSVIWNSFIKLLYRQIARIVCLISSFLESSGYFSSGRNLIPSSRDSLCAFMESRRSRNGSSRVKILTVALKLFPLRIF